MPAPLHEDRPSADLVDAVMVVDDGIEVLVAVLVDAAAGS